ncbi:BID domain-containing T4SS effector [Bartonella taylorii]|uniref:BID domain-containing T4SS effector n=1 Tax=Bartonella taylorii TaxID=33046 RepID=UPI001ABA0C74|nr:BID domain-containing T4SS effector [Bartonella taylorii]
MKKHQPSPSIPLDELRKHFEQQNAEASNIEDLYAKVNKPRREQHPPQQEETIYAPQRPLENPYDRLGERPSNGRRAEKLVNPYAITDLEQDGWLDSQSLENPIYDGVGGDVHGERHPHKPEHTYAELDFSANGEQSFEQLENPIYEGVGSGRTTPPRSPKDEVTSKLSQNMEASNIEDLYAKVNKPRREQHSPQQEETIYAPQRPLENPYDRLGERPSNGRRAEKLVNPYAITDLEQDGWLDSQSLENPLYDGVGGDVHGERHPHKPEHIYAELDFSANGEQSFEKLENPIYEGVGTGRTTPPRTPKDEITSKLLQNTAFQYGVRETQEWCKVVYGNEHALNHQLAQILENPQEGEKVLWSLAENPESVGKLAGRQMLGIKSLDRKQAEDGFSPLYAALESHVETAKKLHKDFTHEQERSQRHERGQNAPEHEAQHKHSPTNQKGMAFAM